LRRLSEELGLAERVKFLGAVKDVASLYRVADICLLLSDWEGFGLVVLEAAQFGIPTVVNDIEGLRQSCPDPRFIASDLTAESVARQILEVEALKSMDDIYRLLDEHWRRHNLGSYIPRLEMIYRRKEGNNDTNAQMDTKK